MAKQKNGVFISIEGMEGSGKTTQLRLLKEWLEKGKGLNPVFTREPGGTPAGEEIRNVLLTEKTEKDKVKKIDSLTETALFFASRRLNVEQVIKPALAEGKTVISDRFADSTYAYQLAAGGIDYKKFKEIYNLMIGDFKPDLTIYFDIDAEIGLKRSVNNTDWQNTETRMESKGIEYHKRVQKGFLELAEKEPNRFKIIDKNETDRISTSIEHDINLTFEILKDYIEKVL